MHQMSTSATHSNDLWGWILPASAEMIRSWSHGAVTSSRLVDPQTRRFDAAGLFSEQIFGPIRDHQCACDQLARAERRDSVCSQCGIIDGPRALRCQRFGAIELKLPVVHPWWYGHGRRPVESLTALSAADLQAVLRRDLAINFGVPACNLNYTLIPTRSEVDPPSLLAELGRQSGAEAIRHVLWLLNGKQLERRLRKRFKSRTGGQAASGTRAAGAASDWMSRWDRRSLRYLSALVCNDVQPEDLVLETIPVIPAGLRCIDLDSSGHLVVDAMTRCYQRIVAIDRAIRRLLDQTPVDAALGNAFPAGPLRGLERRMRQAVARLFAELLAGGAPSGTVVRRLPRRVHLPHRRIWPGAGPIAASRATVVPDPSLRLDECRISREVARELWQPRIVSSLHVQGRPWEKAACYAKERHWLTEFILERMYGKKPTLLALPPVDRPERILALQTRRTDDKAIHVHPLLAAWLGLSLDGEQAVAWHTETIRARDDLSRMRPAAVLRDIATGRNQLELAGDALLGCYWATWEPREQRNLRADALGRNFDLRNLPLLFTSADEVRMALDCGKCGFHTPVVLRLPWRQSIVDEVCDRPICLEGSSHRCTTAGRALLNDVLPPTLPYFDVPFGRKEAAFVMARTLEDEGPEAAMRLIERLVRFGLEAWTRSGASLALSDLRPPLSKGKHLAEAHMQAVKAKKLYDRGILNRMETDSRTHDVWLQAAANIGTDLVMHLDEKPSQLLRMVVELKAGAGQKELQELSGMVGVVRGSSGGYPLIPITRCYAEGLRPHEYFIRAHRARHDRVDRVLKAHDARKLTRRIANVAQNLVVTEQDCGSHEGAFKRAAGIEDRVARPLAELIAGRVSRETIVNPYTDEVIVAESKLITTAAAHQIESLGIDRIEVRSPLTCQSRDGVCQACYGADPRSGQLVALGTAVGALSALAIGGLLPKLRIFIHRWVGPVVRRIGDDDPCAKRSGTVSLKKLDLAVSPQGERVALSAGVIEIVDGKDRVIEQYDVPQGAVIVPAAGMRVSAGNKLAHWNPDALSIYAKAAGTVAIDDLVPGRNMRLDTLTNERGVWRVHDWSYGKHPRIRVEDIAGQTVDFCFLPKDSRLYALPGQSVDRGTLLAKVPTSFDKAGEWIVGGIPRVDELLSAREPQYKAVLAEADGLAEPGTLQPDGRTTIWIHPTDAAGNVIDAPIAHAIDTKRTGRILVRKDERVAAGDRLTSGEASPHDILRVLGLVAAGEFLLAELQKCFRGQLDRIDLDDRHLELLISQMLGFARVETPGDTGLEADEILWRRAILAINERLRRFLKIEEKGDSFMPPGGLVSRHQFDLEARRLEREGGQQPTFTIPWPAGCRPLLMGIDDVACRKSSFLTADGFSMSLRSLAVAALTGRRGKFPSVKDSVATRTLIPAGSGWRRADDDGESGKGPQP